MIEIEQIFPDLFRIEIPLPRNPLRSLNSYFIRGDKRSLIIDTGFNRRECREAFEEAIKELRISMRDTDLFITHLHGDHSGLVHYLATPDTKVWGGEYYSLASAHGVTGPQWAYFADLITESGLRSTEEISLEDHPGYKFAAEPFDRITVIQNGDIIEVGAYRFHCLEMSGHAPDQFCLYEEDKKLLICGDHILEKITPNITVWEAPWSIEHDYLGEYLKNVRKCAELEVDIILPGHRTIIRDHRRRIAELIEHHAKRLDNTMAILGDGTMNGVMVAGRMSWDLSFKSWEEFPPAQKIFATGEALAHLTHLVFTQKLKKEIQDGIVWYSKR